MCVIRTPHAMPHTLTPAQTLAEVVFENAHLLSDNTYVTLMNELKHQHTQPCESPVVQACLEHHPFLVVCSEEPVDTRDELPCPHSIETETRIDAPSSWEVASRITYCNLCSLCYLFGGILVILGIVGFMMFAIIHRGWSSHTLSTKSTNSTHRMS